MRTFIYSFYSDVRAIEVMNDMEKTFDGIDGVTVYRCYEN